MGKSSNTELSQRLSEEREKAQSSREKSLGLEATIQELTRQQLKLTADLSQATDQFDELSTALKEQTSRASLIEYEFEAYKEKYKISGNLEAIQTAVADMQAKLDERSGE